MVTALRSAMLRRSWLRSQKQLESPAYLVADVARTQTGELVLIEINGGRTSGFPPSLHPIEFYGGIAEIEDFGESEDEDPNLR